REYPGVGDDGGGQAGARSRSVRAARTRCPGVYFRAYARKTTVEPERADRVPANVLLDAVLVEPERQRLAELGHALPALVRLLRERLAEHAPKRGVTGAIFRRGLRLLMQDRLHQSVVVLML